MPIINAFTVDLEDWFQGLTSTNVRPELWDSLDARVEHNTHRLLALLDEHDVRATFFVLGHVAERYPDLILQIDAAGHEIGVHGYWHRMVSRLTPALFADELDRALEVLQPLASRPILGHRAPYFSIDGRSLWALEILRAKGFRYDSSVFPTRNMLYGYPGAPRFPYRPPGLDLLEVPAATARWFGLTWPIAGGFYGRALPYAIIRRGIRQINQQGQPAVMYVHPWELDTEQQYNSVTLRERVTHYHGRETVARKLRHLFSDFTFTSLRDLLEHEYV